MGYYGTFIYDDGGTAGVAGRHGAHEAGDEPELAAEGAVHDEHVVHVGELVIRGGGHAVKPRATQGRTPPTPAPHHTHTSTRGPAARPAAAARGRLSAVGYFGTFIYRDGEWQDHGGGSSELVVDIHDSDIATVDYRPAPPGLGRFYLGYQPRDYFEDPDASRPLDVPAEVDGFVGWARTTLGRAPRAEDVRDLVAEDGDTVPDDDFVEDTVARLIQLLGLPLPPALAEVTG